MIRVVIADDHELVRQGIRALLERADDIVVVGEAGSGEVAIELVGEAEPDVLVLDVSMPGLNGVQVAERLAGQRSAPAIVMLTMHTDAALVRRAVDAGVRAYVLKGSIVDDLLLAIRVAAKGGTYLAPEATLEGPGASSEDAAESESLTAREREVLELIGEGLTNRAIGSKLGVSVKTVERHRTSLMAKLDAHSIVELIRIAFQRGYLRIDD
jgi:DNA-binding NarL/FixJ family response regulator